jgi:hypothetical protein
MSSENSLLLLGALIGILASLLTTIVTHLLQNVRDEKDRKWKSEQEILSRWWERKATAYGNIISSLVDMTNSLGIWFDLEVPFDVEANQDEDATAYIKDYRESRRRIEKAEIEGAYIISENAALALKKLLNELNVENESVQFWETLNNRYAASRDCLQIIRAEAHKDLRITV